MIGRGGCPDALCMARDIMRMSGLPEVLAAEGTDIDANGVISELS